MDVFLDVLIAFEGIDGSGKTTQAELLSKRLREEGLPNEILREPGGTSLGEGVRELLLHRADLKINPVTEFLLFSASRAQLVREKVVPGLEQGRIMILDRYFYSSIAYQGYGRGVPTGDIESVSRFATQDITPDIVFMVDLDIDTAMKRRVTAGRKADRMENAEIEFFEKALRGFAYCARQEPNRFVVVDGKEPIERISDKVFGVVMCRIKKVAEEGNAP